MADNRRLVVLLLDDGKDARDTMRELFEMSGCTVVATSTLEDAVSSIKVDNFDLVVTDINLQGVDSDRSGMLFANVVKVTNPQLPVAAYSGKISAADIDPEQYRNFDAYLNKARSDPEKTRQFVQRCILLASQRRQALALAGDTSNIAPSPSAPLTKDFDAKVDALRREIETYYFRKPSVKQLVTALIALVGFIGAIASIVSLLL
jgi:CheY-like chemotaxis protein